MALVFNKNRKNMGNNENYAAKPSTVETSGMTCKTRAATKTPAPTRG